MEGFNFKDYGVTWDMFLDKYVFEVSYTSHSHLFFINDLTTI